MNIESYFIEYIDIYRKKNKMNVPEFCQGVCSIRNYSRYLSKELNLPFDIFIKMIHRLGWTIKDFVIYVENVETNSNIDLAYFIEFVRNFYYKEAEIYLENALKKTIPTYVRTKYFPVARMTFMYKTNQMSKEDYKIKCRDIIKLDELLFQSTITREDAESLILYMQHSEQIDQTRIFDFLSQYILDPDQYRVISNMHAITLTRISTGLMYKLMNQEIMSEFEIEQFKKILILSNKYYFTDSINGLVVEYISFYYAFYKKINHPDKSQLLWYLISLILTRDDSDMVLESLNLSNEEVTSYLDERNKPTSNYNSFMKWVSHHE